MTQDDEDRRLSEMTSPAITAAFLNSFAQTVYQRDPEQPIGRIREGAAFCCDVIAAPERAAG
jgi:hypothetical protein